VKTFFTDYLVKNVQPDWNVLVTTHGGVIREIMRYFKEECKCDFAGMNNPGPLVITPNTSVNEFLITYDNNHKIVSVKCLRLHDTDHLQGSCRTSALGEEQINDSEKQAL